MLKFYLVLISTEIKSSVFRNWVIKRLRNKTTVNYYLILKFYRENNNNHYYHQSAKCNANCNGFQKRKLSISQFQQHSQSFYPLDWLIIIYFCTKWEFVTLSTSIMYSILQTKVNQMETVHQTCKKNIPKFPANKCNSYMYILHPGSRNDVKRQPHTLK